VIGTGHLDNVVVKDTIPKGTVFIDKSLKVDGVIAGDFNGSAISVALNTIEQKRKSSEPVHTITFGVTVQ